MVSQAVTAPHPQTHPQDNPLRHRSSVWPLLMVFVMVILLTFALVGWFGSPFPSFFHKTPLQCNHWIALRGTLEYPQLLCWKTHPAETRSAQIKRWHGYLRSANPHCHLGFPIPLPSHGQRLILSPMLFPQQRCHVRITWMSGNTRVALGIPLRLNHDTAADLAAIPGLSQKVAERIVTYRKTHGSFSSLHELSNIKGIGPKTLSRLPPYLSIP